MLYKLYKKKIFIYNYHIKNFNKILKCKYIIKLLYNKEKKYQKKNQNFGKEKRIKTFIM
jgi:hypothetical protein